MKVAVVYNRESKNVINLFGMPNREKIGMKTIQRLTNSLREGGHQVIAREGDKNLVERLEERARVPSSRYAARVLRRFEALCAKSTR